MDNGRTCSDEDCKGGIGEDNPASGDNAGLLGAFKALVPEAISCSTSSMEMELARLPPFLRFASLPKRWPR